jgi:hypothetical protein
LLPAVLYHRMADRRGRRSTTEPYRSAACQHRNGRVVHVKPLTGEGMRLYQAVEGHECRGAGTDLVGQRGQAELDTLAGIAVR